MPWIDRAENENNQWQNIFHVMSEGAHPAARRSPAGHVGELDTSRVQTGVGTSKGKGSAWVTVQHLPVDLALKVETKDGGR